MHLASVQFGPTSLTFLRKCECARRTTFVRDSVLSATKLHLDFLLGSIDPHQQLHRCIVVVARCGHCTLSGSGSRRRHHHLVVSATTIDAITWSSLSSTMPSTAIPSSSPSIHASHTHSTKASCATHCSTFRSSSCHLSSLRFRSKYSTTSSSNTIERDQVVSIMARVQHKCNSQSMVLYLPAKARVAALSASRPGNHLRWPQSEKRTRA